MVKTVRIGADADANAKSLKLPALVSQDSSDNTNSDLHISKSMFPSINSPRDKKPKKVRNS